MPLKPLVTKRRGPYMTSKQLGVLKALVRGNPDGSRLDVYQLIAAVAPGTTRGSMIVTLRHLFAHGLVQDDALVFRKNKKFRTYSATDLGREMIRPGALPSASSQKVVTP